MKTKIVNPEGALLMIEISELKEKIEKLKAKLEEAKIELNTFGERNAGLHSTTRRLEKEIKKLKSLLKLKVPVRWRHYLRHQEEEIKKLKALVPSKAEAELIKKMILFCKNPAKLLDLEEMFIRKHEELLKKVEKWLKYFR